MANDEIYPMNANLKKMHSKDLDHHLENEKLILNTE